MNLLRVFFPGLGTKHVRVPNGNKNRSFTKKGPGRVHRQGPAQKSE